MPFIIDKKIPLEAKKNLSAFDSLIEFESSNIVDPYLSGHPDIFFRPIGDKIICAPNTPKKFLIEISKHKNILLGNSLLEKTYPHCAVYNCIIMNDLLIHKLEITDKRILEFSKVLKKINVNQGMTNCSSIFIGQTRFITSDLRIFKTLEQRKYSGLYVNPKPIFLTEKMHGMFGGCSGIYKNKLLIIGSLKYFNEQKSIENFCNTENIEIVELYNGQPFDGGSIIYI